MSASLLEGTLAGYAIAIPVGAIAVLIVTTAADASLARGLAAGLGAATADFIYAAVAVAIGGSLEVVLRPVTILIRIIGGCIIGAIAVKGLASVRRGATRNETSLTGRATYSRLLGLTLINPLTMVYFGSLALANPHLGKPPDAVAFVVGVLVASASWQSLLALLGALAGRIFGGPARIALTVVGYGMVFGLAVRQIALI